MVVEQVKNPAAAVTAAAVVTGSNSLCGVALVMRVMKAKMCNVDQHRGMMNGDDNYCDAVVVILLAVISGGRS